MGDGLHGAAPTMERIKKYLTQDQPQKWLFYGDSITHGARHTCGHRDYVELFSERLRFEMARTMDLVVNSAISGDNTRGLLEGFEWRVAQFKPDVVFVMIGMNDCSDGNDISLGEFRDNLDRLTGLIGELGAIPVLQTTCPILPNQAPDRSPNFDAFMDAVRAVAADREIPLIDHTKFWREHSESHFFWMSNEFHPNHFGHRAFARHLFEGLGIWNPDSDSCRLYVP